MAKNITPKRRKRMAQALKLRAEGCTYMEIAEALGVSYVTAHGDVRDGLAEVTKESALNLRDLEVMRLDAHTARMNVELDRLEAARAAGEIDVDRAVRGVCRVVDVLLKISERRSRLYGLESIRADVHLDAAADLRDAFAVILDTPEEELEADLEAERGAAVAALDGAA